MFGIMDDVLLFADTLQKIKNYASYSQALFGR